MEKTKNPRKGLWLSYASDNEMIFRKPISLRVLFGLLLVVMIVGFKQALIMCHNNLTAIIPFSIFYGLFIIGLASLACPEETQFDLRRRTYYYRKCLLWWPTYERTGNFDELTGFRINNADSMERKNYWLTVIISRPDQKRRFWNIFTNYPCLGDFGRRQTVEEQVQYLSEMLGIPSEIVWY